MSHAIDRLLYGNPIYALTLGSDRPTSLRFAPIDPWPGDAARGEALMAGRYRFGGESIQAEQPTWFPIGASDPFLAGLHSFTWLRDLRALGGDAARRHARSLVDRWLRSCRRWHPVVWRPDVLGRRLGCWLQGHDFFCASADDAYRARVFASLARQHRHLARTLPGRRLGAPAWAAAFGFAIAAISLPGGDRDLAAASKRLIRELDRVIRDDGGSADRNPQTMVDMLRDLIDLRTALTSAPLGSPDAAPGSSDGIGNLADRIEAAIDRLAGAIRLLRHGDGGLALFHGAREGDRVLVDTLLLHAGTAPRPLRSGSDAGYHRLSAGRLAVILDTALPPPPGYDDAAHAAPLAMEVSVGRQRVIVNCGAWDGAGGRSGKAWFTALRGTSAHSTLSPGKLDQPQMNPTGLVAKDVADLAVDEDTIDGGRLVEASFRCRSTGLTHQRRLWLAASGDDLRGEELVSGTPADDALPLVVRFHLHPDIEVDQTDDRTLLTFPDGQGWIFHADGIDLSVEESIYAAKDGSATPTTQLVLAATFDAAAGTVIPWALKRDRAP